MVHYEAVATSLLPNGKAEILIQLDRTGDPNAPACHCGADRTYTLRIRPSRNNDGNNRNAP